jgi:hypothetical protein
MLVPGEDSVVICNYLTLFGKSGSRKQRYPSCTYRWPDLWKSERGCDRHRPAVPGGALATATALQRASVLFKPAASMTAYATYANSLQAGDLAQGAAANAGVGVAPYRSNQ